MLTGYVRGRRDPALALANDVRSIAALEFALLAPILLVMSLATFDIARALLVWQQINHAAEAVVEAADKLSVTTVNGVPTVALDPRKMQIAMTTIYAQMPGLNLGVVQGAIFPGSFSVTLSSVAFTPLCPQTTNNVNHACTQAQINSQVPVLLWSSYLVTGGAGSLNATPSPSPPLRPCADQPRPGGNGVGLLQVAQLPNILPTQYGQMPDPDLVPNAAQIVRVPQLIADVQYQFKPTFPLFSRIIAPNGVNFVASATLPAPLGLTNQEVTLINDTGQTINESSLPTKACN